MYISSYTLTAQLAFALLTPTTSAQYSLQDDYSPSSFASMFDFFTDGDPTDGYVNYISQSQAESEGLFSTNNGSVYIGVDSKNVASGRGRDSVRISSKKSYNHGLIVLDLEHMPGGQCGSWPAFWTLGSSAPWPQAGEIDIIENVNSAKTNQMTTHTNSGCTITSTGQFAGTLETSNCDVNAAGQATNAGCSIGTGNTQSYGTGFNAAGGGVYATEWTSQAISIWFFPRSAIPADLSSGAPNPSNWGIPLAQFTGGCNIDEHFVNQQIVFDITFCGQWAGSVWSTDATCSPLGSTCQSYVQNNPTAFADTYWSINSLKVFQANGQATPSSTASTQVPTSTVVATTSAVATTFSTATVTVTTPAVPTTVPTVSSAPTIAPTTYSTLTTYSAPTTYTPPPAPSTYTNTWSAQSNTWTAPAAGQTQGWNSWQGGQSTGWGGQGGNSWGQGGGGGWGGRGGPPK